MVMGANIGTSITNTFVAIGQIGVKEDFRCPKDIFKIYDNNID